MPSRSAWPRGTITSSSNRGEPLEAVQGILDREEYGSVITFVEGPDLGAKVVLDSAGQTWPAPCQLTSRRI